ncbi:phosphate ABC transporter permease PstA [Brooklawnia cerclae]|uniref:Phosphate transport system permease protein PstA n=1 Tax=Brooklawnia cerclae TaxID=349934 RepID=A0ABX0SCF5_9ACTN|nr:phosphate ABC transporter permease PstA [Brooklawnia cerclae]NIH55604.1 phosphate transport system permease protein [Brooklawnia cerclae]
MSIDTTTTGAQPEARIRDTSLTGGQLPKYTDLALLVVSVCVAAALLALFGAFGIVTSLILGVLIFLVSVYALAFAVEGQRRASNRLARYVIFGAFILALIPLVSLLVEVIGQGWNRFDLDYFTQSKRNVVGEGGGASHAIAGTLIVTGLATLFSVPIGLFTAIYLVEYGNNGFLKRAITFLVDVMTGIPSIVAGLFAYALFSTLLGPSKSGLAGAVALSVLMIPYVVRNSEEIIRLVPNSLREASYALGVKRWRTIVRVVLPTSISGIVSGVILAIARIIGETAPLLVTMGFTDSMNYNPLPTGGNAVNPMTSLPVFVYYEYTRPGRPQSAYFDRAWTGALILVLIVMILNIVGRIIAKRFAPKINR